MTPFFFRSSLGRRMRLRTRLALAFALLAVVPLALVVPPTIVKVDNILSKELEARLSSAAALTDVFLSDLRRSSRAAVADIATSVAVEDFARELRNAGAAAERVGAAERLMNSRGLSVLSLLDDNGVILSSGHLPARVGDRDPALLTAIQSGAAGAVAALVEVRDETGVHRIPALVAARAFDDGDRRLWVVGGQRLDFSVADQLSRMSGAQIQISTDEAIVATAGSAEPPVSETAVDLPPAARLSVRLSRAPVLQTRALLVRAFVALALFGLALAALLGVWVARLVTGPIEAVTAAARKIAGGAFQLQVPESYSGEAGELVRAFNRMTTELESRTQQLVASERIAAWEEVARRLAHEIKNPLTPIKISLETLVAASEQGQGCLEELFRQTASAVLEEVERLRRILDEFSQFARPPKPHLQTMSLSQLVGQALALYAHPQGKAELRSHIERDVFVRGDRDQLTQVLLNLLNNAEDAVGDGGWIELRVKRAGERALLEVADSGPGIAWENRPRVFEPYFSTKPGGSGLGLAIAQRICQEHGGQLVLSSQPGAGAVFTVSLPAISPSASTSGSEDRVIP